MPKSILIILDGWGINSNPMVSAVEAADTSFFDSIWENYPHAVLTTHGEMVGLPEGQMGNSEVGHLNIGAGRIIYQELARINKAIRERELDKNPVLQNELSVIRGNLHLVGLVSDGGVHSHIDHLIDLARVSRNGFKGNIFIHAFTDGRDVDPKSGLGFIQSLEHIMKDYRIPVVSVVGRYYAMDRDKRWERTKVAYDMLTKGTGLRTDDLIGAITKSYEEGVTDEFIKPIVSTNKDGLPEGRIKDGDTVIFFNFRTDRPRQLTVALSQKAFPEHDMQPLGIRMVTMTNYDDTFSGINVLFPYVDITGTLGEHLEALGKTQLRIAETEKYPHVSYFFSGGREVPFKGEERILIPSPKVPTYDLLPEMSAPDVTDAAIAFIEEHQPDFICLNYANPDMVGHTGVFKAAVKAVETVDECLQKLIPVCLRYDYSVLIIADHGNADVMVNPDGSPNTAHTKNPVPVLYVANDVRGLTIKSGILADIAPTLLHIMHLPIPAQMTGNVLISDQSNSI